MRFFNTAGPVKPAKHYCIAPLERLGLAEVLALLGQHTAETGQVFTAEAQDSIWDQTQGQPWLVNALAYEACFKAEAGRDRSHPIAAAAIAAAREQLILRRETHLDQLADKLQEERVRRVVEPLLSTRVWVGTDADGLANHLATGRRDA